MSGPLPLELQNTPLTYFNYYRTGLCAPQDASFTAWLATVGGDFKEDRSVCQTSTSASPSARATGLELAAISPNPVGRAPVAIRFSIALTSEVQLDVIDVLGRRVVLVHEGLLAAGSHEAQFDPSGLVPGTYIVRLQAGGEALTRPVAVVR